jgi:LysR family transcriptional regulator for bpeEF and oprC
VAELGSVTRAAEQLQWSKASVTVLVQQLEEHLTVKLLSRTTRRLTLPDDGAAYLEGVQRVLADIDELGGALAKRRTQLRGCLRVDVPAAAGRHMIAPAPLEFFQLYPEIQLELGSSDRPVDLIAEGVDCVIHGGAVQDSSLLSRPLGMFGTIACASPAYLKAHGKPKTPDEIAEHQTVDVFSAKTGRVVPFDFA